MSILSLAITDELRALIQERIGPNLKLISTSFSVTVESTTERVEQATAAPGETR